MQLGPVKHVQWWACLVMVLNALSLAILAVSVMLGYNPGNLGTVTMLASATSLLAAAGSLRRGDRA
jgi:hypothetical protein